MKVKTRLNILFAIFLSFYFMIGVEAQAFHSGSVGDCAGCHAMHTSSDNQQFQVGPHLLKGSDQSSVCLKCHQYKGDTGPNSYHISTDPGDMPTGIAPLQRTPGGDFGWLKKSYSFLVGGSTIAEPGDSHGHNIVAADFSYTADANNPAAPGGAFPSNQLACNSCHDPHGKYRRLSTGAIATTGASIIGSGSYDTSVGNGIGNPIPAGQAVGVYRLLAGAGYSKGGITFNGVPAAVAPSTYNQAEGSNQVRVAYGVAKTNGHETWGQWCSTCHSSLHSSGNYVHPTDQGLGSTLATNYTNYVSSGIMSGIFTGNQAGQGPYTSLVPFSENTGDYAILGSHAKSDGTYLSGPGSSDQVNCLSCHRVHASGFPHALRWKIEGEFITYGASGGSPVWPGTDTTPTVPQLARGRTSTEMKAAYYDRSALVFGAYQRVLCNKCHAKD